MNLPGLPHNKLLAKTEAIVITPLIIPPNVKGRDDPKNIT